MSMMDARRKAKAAAAPATVAEKVAPEKKEKKAKASGSKATGSMRTIAAGRHYKDGHTAKTDENGMPLSRAYFDPAGRSAKTVEKGWDKDRTVPIKDLIRHMNQELFRPLFGQPLRGAVARDLVFGFADILIALSEQGYKYKIPNGFGVETKTRAPRLAHNPKTKQQVKVPARRVVKVRPTRAVREFIASGG